MHVLRLALKVGEFVDGSLPALHLSFMGFLASLFLFYLLVLITIRQRRNEERQLAQWPWQNLPSFALTIRCWN